LWDKNVIDNTKPDKIETQLRTYLCEEGGGYENPLTRRTFTSNRQPVALLLLNYRSKTSD